jgi:DNA-binding FadR family transcriptional regulator
MLEPVERVSLTDAVFGQLKKLILDRNLQPGDRIPTEKVLCAQLRVTRTALREAKQAPVAMGVLETSAGGGTSYRGGQWELLSEPLNWGMWLRSQDVCELVEARIVVESASAALAAKRATDGEKASLVRMTERLRAAFVNNCMDRYAEADPALHTAIAQMAHNKMLLRMMQAIRALLRKCIAASLSLPGTAAASLEAHERLIGAIADDRSAQARRLMEAHLEDVRDRILGIAVRNASGENGPAGTVKTHSSCTTPDVTAIVQG